MRSVVLFVALVLLGTGLVACSAAKHRPANGPASVGAAAAAKPGTDASYRYYNDWCAVTVTPLASFPGLPQPAGGSPGNASRPDAGSPRQYVFRVRITNEKAAVGPLRYCSRSLEEYQQQYAYLLNNGKADFFLQAGGTTYYPSSYLYTTHYSAFPLEEILVGFSGLPQKLKSTLTLCYIDRLFLHDTLRYRIHPGVLRQHARSHIPSDSRP